MFFIVSISLILLFIISSRIISFLIFKNLKINRLEIILISFINIYFLLILSEILSSMIGGYQYMLLINIVLLIITYSITSILSSQSFYRSINYDFNLLKKLLIDKVYIKNLSITYLCLTFLIVFIYIWRLFISLHFHISSGDDLLYHLPIVSHFIKDGAITTSYYNIWTLMYPKYGEMLYLPISLMSNNILYVSLISYLLIFISFLAIIYFIELIGIKKKRNI